MKNYQKTTGTALALAMLATSIAPALAADMGNKRVVAQSLPQVDDHIWTVDDETVERRRYLRYRRYRHRDRVDAGDVIAGVLILGGIAAVIDAASRDSRRNPRNERYERRDVRANDMDSAERACSDAIERRAGQDARVERINGISRDGNGWRIEGTVRSSYGNERFLCGTSNGQVDYIQLDEPQVASTY